MDIRGQYVVISGNIGVGKSTLVDGLARRLSAHAAPERPSHNPWFTQAARAGQRWAMHAQSFFLMDSAAQAIRLVPKGTTVQERFPREHVRVMARLQNALGRLSDDELQLLELSLSVVELACPQPSAIIWLRLATSELGARIHSRGRPEEHDLSVEVLDLLEQLYAAFFSSWQASPLLELDVGTYDFRDCRSISSVADWLHRSVDRT